MIWLQQERRSVRWPVLTYAGEVGSRPEAELFQSQPAIRVSITSGLSKEQSAQMEEASIHKRHADRLQAELDAIHDAGVIFRDGDVVGSLRR